MYKSSVTANEFHPNTQRFFNGKHVSVTGGTGFIGSHLVEQLHNLGANINVLTRQQSSAYLRNVSKNITTTSCDLNNYDEVYSSIQGSDVVINLAAMVAGLEYNEKHPATIFHTNMEMFLNVIKASQQAKVKYFSACSTACVYPRYCSIPTPEEEGFMSEPEPTNSGYGWSKRMQEYLAQQYAKEFGMVVAIPRPYNAYGPRDNFNPKSSHVIPALIHKAFTTEEDTFEVWGDGTHSRSFLYVDDFARGVLEVTARYHCAEPINIGANEEVTINEVATLIAKVASEKRGFTIKPKFNDKGLTGQPRRCCSTEKLSRHLGYETKVSFQSGIRQTVEWYSIYENSLMYSHV